MTQSPPTTPGLDAQRSPEAQYRAVTATSALSFSAARRRVPSGMSRHTFAFAPYPMFAGHGRGQYLWDVDGNRYLDFVNNYTSLIHGHAHPASVAAAVAELNRGGVLGAPSPLELELAEVLVERFPSIERLRFALSGSEAITFALRAARAFTGRSRVLKFEGGFHGGMDEVQHSISAAPLSRGEFGHGIAHSKGLLPVPTLVSVYNDVESVRAAFSTHGSEIAAVVVEPFLGNAGLLAAEPGFLATVERIAHEHGALLVLDEIQSMRLAYGGAQELHGIRPDLTTLGKIMGGGLPLAAYGGRSDVMQVFEGLTPDVPQTGTYTAFPAALAAGLATMRAFDPSTVAAINDLGESARTGIRQAFAHHNVPVTVTGQGSMFHVVIGADQVTDYRTWRTASTTAWTDVRMALLARGVYITARGTGCLSTPTTAADLDRFLAELHRAIGESLLCQQLRG